MNSGVYIIKNIINSKFYLGSSVDLRKRKNNHFSDLNFNRHHSTALQNAYNKYGKENFEFEVIAICPPEYCIKLEQWFIDNMKPNYNICKIAGSMFGRKHSEETKLKISKKAKGRVNSRESIERQRQKVIGRKHSKEAIEKMRRIKLEKGCTMTEESKKSISEKNSIPVLKIDKQGNIVDRYSSGKEAAEKNNLSKRTVWRHCSKRSAKYQLFIYEKDLKF